MGKKVIVIAIDRQNAAEAEWILSIFLPFYNKWNDGLISKVDQLWEVDRNCCYNKSFGFFIV